MRCPECQQEVVLARTCPYCGAAVPQPEEPLSSEEQGQDHPRGRFQGRLESGPRGSQAGSAPPGPGSRPASFLARLGRYMFNPQVPARSKLLVVLGALYLLSPLDLLPGLFPISWLDDLGLMGVLWMWLSREFDRYS